MDLNEVIEIIVPFVNYLVNNVKKITINIETNFIS